MRSISESTATATRSIPVSYTHLFITHDVEEAVLLATKVIIMSARPGRIKKIVDINLPYPRTQEMKMELPFLDLKTYIWGEVYHEYLEVRK